MAFRIEDIRYPAWSRVVAGEFANVRPLAMAPVAREAMLDAGVWLIVVVPVWSGTCRRAIDDVTAMATQLPDGVNVGVRWFDEYEEIAAWLPNAEQSYSTPQWFLLRDGAIVKQRFGPLGVEKIVPFVSEPPVQRQSFFQLLRAVSGSAWAQLRYRKPA